MIGVIDPSPDLIGHLRSICILVFMMMKHVMNV